MEISLASSSSPTIERSRLGSATDTDAPSLAVIMTNSECVSEIETELLSEAFKEAEVELSSDTDKEPVSVEDKNTVL